MLIIMMGTFRGSNDASNVKQYVHGNVYDTLSNGDDYIGNSLASSFIREGKARKMEDTEYLVLAKVNARIMERFSGES